MIEDNPGDFELVSDYLTESIEAPVVKNVVNYRETFALLASGTDHFDVILLDLTLPDKEMYGLVTEMLRMANSCPVIILTGYTNIDFAIKSISQGVADYLLKDELSAEMLYKSIVYAIERRKTMLHLAESEKRYSDLFHLNPEAMWVYDVNSLYFLDVNRAAVERYGYNREEFLSMKTSVMESSEEESKAFGENPFSAKANADIFNGVFRHRKKNQALIYVDVYSKDILFNGKPACLVLAYEITDRINYVSAIQKQNEKLREIAWIQSHVVRAPLARMMAIVNFLKDCQLNSPECDNLLRHFSESAQELDSIIREITEKTERIDLS